MKRRGITPYARVDPGYKAHVVDADARPYVNLWISVLRTALKDLKLGCPDAVDFFFHPEDEADRRLVIDLSGFDYEYLMKAITYAQRKYDAEKEHIAQAARDLEKERADEGPDSVQPEPTT